MNRPLTGNLIDLVAAQVAIARIGRNPIFRNRQVDFTACSEKEESIAFNATPNQVSLHYVHVDTSYTFVYSYRRDSGPEAGVIEDNDSYNHASIGGDGK